MEAKENIMKDKNEIKVNIIDVLLDDNNTEPIIMYKDDGSQIKFDQIAVIPLDDADLYAVLKPITKIDGIKDNEAVVFQAIEDGEDSYLKIVEDEKTAIRVFNIYYDLVEKDAGIYYDKIDLETIITVIKNDPNLQNVYDEETKELIDYTKMDVRPFRYGKELYAIIKESYNIDIKDSLVWKLVDGERLEWIENEEMQSLIIKMYLDRKGE